MFQFTYVCNFIQKSFLDDVVASGSQKYSILYSKLHVYAYLDSKPTETNTPVPQKWPPSSSNHHNLVNTECRLLSHANCMACVSSFQSM